MGKDLQLVLILHGEHLLLPRLGVGNVELFDIKRSFIQKEKKQRNE